MLILGAALWMIYWAREGGVGGVADQEEQATALYSMLVFRI